MMKKNNAIHQIIVEKRTTASSTSTSTSTSKTKAVLDTATQQQDILPKSNVQTKIYSPFHARFALAYLPWQFHFYYQYVVNKLESKIKSPIESPIQYLEMLAHQQHIFAEATVGIQHRQAKHALPCQDAVASSLRPRPILIVCDGAGSAAVSDLGSQALANQMIRLCQSLEPFFTQQLDHPPVPDLQELVRVLIRHAMGVLQDLSTQHRRSIRDFRSTLNLTIIGKKHILWLKVGDGEIIQERLQLLGSHQVQANYTCLGQQHKGEFANQTQFIDDQLSLDDVQWGILETKYTSGLALMSDGASEKLVSHQRDRVSGQITQWLQQLRSQQFSVAEIYQRFYAKDFLARSTGDDRSIALYSAEYEA